MQRRVRGVRTINGTSPLGSLDPEDEPVDVCCRSTAVGICTLASGDGGSGDVGRADAAREIRRSGAARHPCEVSVFGGMAGMGVRNAALRHQLETKLWIVWDGGNAAAALEPERSEAAQDLEGWGWLEIGDAALVAGSAGVAPALGS